MLFLLTNILNPYILRVQKHKEGTKMNEMIYELQREMLDMDQLKENLEGHGISLEYWLEFKLREVISKVEEEFLDNIYLKSILEDNE